MELLLSGTELEAVSSTTEYNGTFVSMRVHTLFVALCKADELEIVCSLSAGSSWLVQTSIESKIEFARKSVCILDQLAIFT